MTHIGHRSHYSPGMRQDPSAPTTECFLEEPEARSGWLVETNKRNGGGSISRPVEAEGLLEGYRTESSSTSCIELPTMEQATLLLCFADPNNGTGARCPTWAVIEAWC